jgi:hypothetical protein
MLIGVFPSWPYSKVWGHGPSGGLGSMLLIAIRLLITGRLWRAACARTPDAGQAAPNRHDTPHFQHLPTQMEPPMQILLNTNPHINDREAMQAYLESAVQEMLGQFADRITQVEAYLSEADGTAQAGPSNGYCTLEVRLIEHEPVVTRHDADTVRQALHGTLLKLGCVLASEFEKQDHQHAFPAHAEARPIAAPQAVAQALQP